MDYQTLFGIMLIASCGIAMVCGLYAINMNLKNKVNKSLFFICCAISIWSFGLAITVVADNAEICSIGHIIAPIGWGPMSGLLLHFTLLLTAKEKLLKKWWIYPVLYLPGLVMIYAFTILPAIGHNTDGFFHTPYGWAPIVHNDGWDHLFYTYYIGFTITNLVILLSTRIKSYDKNKRAQASLLAKCYIIAYTFGTLTDIVFEQLNIIIPQFSPVFSLLPIGAIIYSVKRYGPLSPEHIDRSEVILTNDVRRNVYYLMSLIFAAWSVINIIIQSENGYMGGFSLFLIIISSFIIIINQLSFNDEIKELLLAIIYSLVIPLITLWFVQSGSITIWAFIFLLLVVCMLYNRRLLLIAVIMSAIMTQVLVWVRTPTALVEINEADYIVRLGFIGIAAILSIFVNAIYITRLKENTFFGQKQKLLSDISRDFISAEESNINDKIYSSLEKCAEFLKCQHAFIIMFQRNSKKIQYSCEWLEEGASSNLKNFKDFNQDIYQEIFKHLDSNNIVQLADLKHLPLLAEKFKEVFLLHDLGALIALPIKEQDDTLGFMCFNFARPLKEWNIDSTDFIAVVTNIVSDTLIKIDKEKKIKFLAYYDQLSRLPNRILFNDRLEQAINQAKRTEKMIGLVYINLDSFKSVNDTMGHDIGDKLLSEVAERLSSNIRNYDAVSRFGGDEYVIMLNQILSTCDILTILDKIMNVLNKPINLRNQEFFITASVGVAIYPQDGEDADTLIRNADIAMYNAKKLGKNRYLMCSKDMKDQILEKMRLTNYLYRALEREQLMLYYQPQVNVETNTLVGLEALLRWSIPERGMVSPATFIPLAEQTGLINQIGEWVLETACRQNKLWQDKGLPRLRMAVNISVHQLNNSGFVEQVNNIIKKTGISPKDLELEITESAASANVKAIIEVLSKLKELGVSIALDDFGTEYSSLSRLKILPIDRVKMDMQFVQGIEGNKKDQAIPKVIIDLARKMNLKVIAEGVETELQLDFLRKYRCDEVQGYYYYKPMPVEEIEKILLGDEEEVKDAKAFCPI